MQREGNKINKNKLLIPMCKLKLIEAGGILKEWKLYIESL